VHLTRLAHVLRVHSELLETAKDPAICKLLSPKRLQLHVHEGPWIVAEGISAGVGLGVGLGAGVAGKGVGAGVGGEGGMGTCRGGGVGACASSSSVFMTDAYCKSVLVE
jgi:hypothetical protein